MGRGWTSTDLKAVGDDDRLWTVAEAACLLGPPRLTIAQVRHLIAFPPGIEPVGKRRTSPRGQAGRYARVYRAKDFIEAHDKLSR